MADSGRLSLLVHAAKVHRSEWTEKAALVEEDGALGENAHQTVCGLAHL